MKPAQPRRRRARDFQPGAVPISYRRDVRVRLRQAEPFPQAALLPGLYEVAAESFGRVLASDPPLHLCLHPFVFVSCSTLARTAMVCTCWMHIQGNESSKRKRKSICYITHNANTSPTFSHPHPIPRSLRSHKARTLSVFPLKSRADTTSSMLPGIRRSSRSRTRLWSQSYSSLGPATVSSGG